LANLYLIKLLARKTNKPAQFLEVNNGTIWIR